MPPKADEDNGGSQERHIQQHQVQDAAKADKTPTPAIMIERDGATTMSDNANRLLAQ